MSNVIKKQTALNTLRDIYMRLWDIDIPSPTVPEYVEHHEQIQALMQYTNEWIEKLQALEEGDDSISRKTAVETIGDKMIQGDNIMAIWYNHGIADCVANSQIHARCVKRIHTTLWKGGRSDGE